MANNCSWPGITTYHFCLVFSCYRDLSIWTHASHETKSPDINIIVAGLFVLIKTSSSFDSKLLLIGFTSLKKQEILSCCVFGPCAVKGFSELAEVLEWYDFDAGDATSIEVTASTLRIAQINRHKLVVREDVLNLKKIPRFRSHLVREMWQSRSRHMIGKFSTDHQLLR